MSLLSRIERFRTISGMAETAFGRAAVNDPRLIGDIRRGRCVGPRVLDRVERLLASRPE